MRCSICGEYHGAGQFTIIEKRVFCNKCRDNLFYECSDCGEYVPKGAAWRTYNGEYICNTCRENDYTRCDDCDELYPNDDIQYLEGADRYVCDDCKRQNYIQCHECGNYINEDDAYYNYNDEPFCEDCFHENYCICERCGRCIDRDDTYWIGNYDDTAVCYDCYDKEKHKVIHSYHSSVVTYTPRRRKYEKVSERLYGIELEVAGNCDYAPELKEILGDDVVFMYDSSVSGFEIITMPMTKAYYEKDFLPVLEKGLQFLKDKGFRGHNYGGMHVHFSEIEDINQLINMTKVIYGDLDSRNIWLAITQRRSDEMSRWASMTNQVYTSSQIKNHQQKSPAGDNNHGTALNYDNRTNTHELRIFNSNLRIERIRKNMECVFALLDYTADYKSNKKLYSTNGFLNYVKRNKENYPFLANFMEEKQIFNNDYFPEASVEDELEEAA